MILIKRSLFSSSKFRLSDNPPSATDSIVYSDFAASPFTWVFIALDRNKITIRGPNVSDSFCVICGRMRMNLSDLKMERHHLNKRKIKLRWVISCILNRGITVDIHGACLNWHFYALYNTTTKMMNLARVETFAGQLMRLILPKTLLSNRVASLKILLILSFFVFPWALSSCRLLKSFC